ncbi:MAG TPA: TlpA disulfide reductase family protein [Candidatus Limnocylindrales bacterium]|nr:TlpA disulfide reductase family protein [Candidatus Limnocylindrales bacterium]
MLALILPAASYGDSARQQARLRLTDLDGRVASLQRHRGKVVLVNFWATWCEACGAELPVLVDLAARYKERGLVVLAASADDVKAKDAVAKVAKSAKDLQIWVGADGDDMQEFGFAAALPASALVDRNGRIAERFAGGITKGQLDTAIEMLLQENIGGADAPIAIEAGTVSVAPGA